MKIKSVEICNWRSIKKVNIDFQDLMIFIGQNNHGKSNILNSLLFFFNKIPCDIHDFNDTTKDLYVEIVFYKLDDFDKNQFKSYVATDGSIRVRRTCDINRNSRYNGYKEIAETEWLRSEKVGDFVKREIFEQLPIKDYLPPGGRISIAVFQEAQKKYIEDHRNEIELNYTIESTNFQGVVGKGIFGEVYHLQSVKDAQDELAVRGASIFNQLYSRILNKVSQNNSQYTEAKEKLDSLSSLFNKIGKDGKPNELRPQELVELENKLQEELKNWDAKFEVIITPPKIDDIFRLNADVLIDDGHKDGITRKGHGLQRALIFALLKIYSKIIEEERKTENFSTTSTRGTSNSDFFILEEPELYLHPQAQKETFASLIKLAASVNDQVILCTHSNMFVDLNYHKSICIVKKENLNDGTKCLQCVDDVLNENEGKNFSIVYWVNPERSELFFAKKVILVEGSTEKAVIPYLATKMEVFKYDYSLVDCGSKDSMPNYIKLLNKFKLNYVVVYDKDHQSEKDSEKLKNADGKSKLIEDSIDSNLGFSILMENDIEEEIGLTIKSKPYKALKHIEDENYNIPAKLMQKIQAIYN